MKDLMIFVAALAAVVLVWRGYAGWVQRKRHWRRPVAHMVGAVMGMSAGLLVLLALIPGKPTQTAAAALPEAPGATPVPAATTAPLAAPQSLGVTLAQYRREVDGTLPNLGIKARLKGLSKPDGKGIYTGTLGDIEVSTSEVDGRLHAVYVRANRPVGVDGPAALMFQQLMFAALPADMRKQAVDAVVDAMRESAVYGDVAMRQVGPYAVNFQATDSAAVGAVLPGKVPAHDGRDRSAGAWVMCQQAVKDRLKAPASAEFPPDPDKVLRNPNNGDSYVVRGHVDAQNSFGAMMRVEWICQIAYNGKGDEYDDRNWTVFGLPMQQR